MAEVRKDNPNLKDKEIFDMANQYATAMAVLHEKGIVHCDQKPENTYIKIEKNEDGSNRYHVKVGDFGYAVMKGEDIAGGTPGFLAPELALKAEIGETIPAEPSSDVWQMGCVFAEMLGKGDWINYCADLSENKMWSDSDPKFLQGKMEKYFHEFYDSGHPDYIIAKCLNIDPKERSSAEEVAKMWDNLAKYGDAEG